MNSLRIAHEHHVYSDHVEATPEYWDSIANEWQQQGDERSWRVVSDAVNLELLRRWLPMEHGGRVLKTDLFDEGVGTGLVPQLTARFDHVAGIDISPSLVAMVRARFPQLEAEIADVRALPFADASFDAVVSNSTLDHFTSRDDIEASFRELNRVMRVGGTFLVTLDNPLNPVVAIRNGLSDRLRAATHLVPFAVGATCGPRQLRTLLRASGFEVARMSGSSIAHACSPFSADTRSTGLGATRRSAATRDSGPRSKGLRVFPRGTSPGISWRRSHESHDERQPGIR